MAQTYPLDKVIRIVNSAHAIGSPQEHIVVIDVESGKAIEIIDSTGSTQLQRVGILGRFKDRKYFLVANNTDSRNEAEGRVPTFSLRDFVRKWTLGLEVNYLASCRPSNEAKVAEGLCGGSHPGAVLNDSITRWMKDFAGSRPADLIENYYSKKVDLEAHIAARALDEVGLNLQAIVRLESEREALNPIDIGPVHLPVRVKDYDEEQDLRLKAEIQVDPQRKIYAILYRHQIPRLGDLLKAETRKYFAAAVSLHQFHAELRSPGLKAGLTSHLNSVLRPFGRQIGFLSFEQKNNGERLDQAFFEARENVEFEEVKEYEEKVVIKNTVQMTLRDYALYKNDGSKDLNLWIKMNLKEVIREVLFGKRYIDLLIGFEPLEREIKAKLSIRAEAIGYSIKHLITVPDLPPYDWLENFTLEVEREYDTNTPKFPVKLGVIVTARIRRLKDIESFLNRRQDVPKLMKSAIEDEARRFLHTVDPERFYLRFSYTEPEEKEEAIEEALKKLIEQRLEEKFKAEVISIVFKMLDTEVTEIWSLLEKSEGNLEIKLPSFSDVEGVTYRGRIRVESIHARGWNRFRTSNPEMDRICRRLEEHVVAQLGTFANFDLVYTNLESQRQVERLIETLVKKFAVEEFGLVVRVNNIRREATGIEIDEKERILGLLEARKALEKERIAEITMGGTPEKINALEERIKKVDSELSASVAATRMKFTRPELVEPASPTRLADVFTGRKSIAAGARPHNNHREDPNEPSLS
jgi:hypothetical protein